MLYTNTVEPKCLEILIKLMAIQELSNFSLAGGTALALKYGHRLSVDIDLFSPNNFNNHEVINMLANNFVNFSYLKSSESIGIFGYIDDLKVDLIKHHNFEMIHEIEVKNQIRFFSDEDLMAMKVFAILQRGVKKDFWDIAELMNKYSISKMIECYYKKYPKNLLAISIPTALVYFDDANESEDPICLRGQKWDDIKGFISEKVNEFLK